MISISITPHLEAYQLISNQFVNLFNLFYLPMEIKTIMPACGNSNEYVPPSVEIFDVEIEQGFAASSGNNEQWNDVPGGGNF